MVDRDALAALYESHAPMVGALALRMLGDRTESEDVVQDTFLHVYRALPAFRGDASPRTWIYRIAVNECLQRIRRRQPRPAREAADIQRLIDAAGTQPHIAPEDAVLLAEVLEQIQEGCYIALTARLPVNQRTVYVFVDLLDWSVESTAGLLGISLAAAKSRLHRARENMALFFGPKCSHLGPANPCTCMSRVPAAEQFDPDLIRRAKARLDDDGPRRRAPAGPHTLREMVRDLPLHTTDADARARFFALIDQGLPETESGDHPPASKETTWMQEGSS
ncbi:MAG TPA: RNA polymerase sigma factor [Symbiobacteriaceae bacterium]|nr:RNA polymerase sigma factor [Symbiobacteriaceae bacterium]